MAGFVWGREQSSSPLQTSVSLPHLQRSRKPSRCDTGQGLKFQGEERPLRKKGEGKENKQCSVDPSQKNQHNDCLTLESFEGHTHGRCRGRCFDTWYTPAQSRSVGPLNSQASSSGSRTASRALLRACRSLVSVHIPDNRI